MEAMGLPLGKCMRGGKKLTLKRNGGPGNRENDVSGFYPFSKKKKEEEKKEKRTQERQESKSVNNDPCKTAQTCRLISEKTRFICPNSLR